MELKFSHIDILVNNAGIIKRIPMIDMEVEDFEAVIKVDLISPFIVSKAVAKVGIYDLLIHHDQILEPCIRRHWKLEEITGLSDEAERARENIFKQMARTQKVGKRLAGDRVDAWISPLFLFAWLGG